MTPRRAFIAALALSATLTANPALAGENACQRAAARAEARHGLPEGLLAAIGLVETGVTRKGRYAPWPYTINVEGRGYRFNTERAARAHVAGLAKVGKRSIDVGCFQINLKWHAEAFASPEDYFDADVGANYAAQFLLTLKAEKGGWRQAVGAYHSRQSTRGARYARKVYAALGAPQGETHAAPKAIAAPVTPAPGRGDAWFPSVTADERHALTSSIALTVFADRPPLLEDAARANLLTGLHP